MAEQLQDEIIELRQALQLFIQNQTEQQTAFDKTIQQLRSQIQQLNANQQRIDLIAKHQTLTQSELPILRNGSGTLEDRADSIVKTNNQHLFETSVVLADKPRGPIGNQNGDQNTVQLLADSIKGIHDKLSNVQIKAISSNLKNNIDPNTQLYYYRVNRDSPYTGVLECKRFSQDEFPFYDSRTKTYFKAEKFQTKNNQKTNQRFNWVGIRNNLIQFIKHCIQCQQNKNSRLPQLPIHMIKQPDCRFKHIHLDLMGKMSGDPNYNYTLHIRDRFTGYLVISPLIGSTSDEILDSFISTYISRYGLPELLVTDNASNLNSETVQLFNKKLGIKHINSTAYHPPSNGTIDRPNLQVKATMRCLKGYQWSKVIPIIELCFNNAATNNSAYTPAQLVYGCSQRLPNDFIESPSTLNNTHQRSDSTIGLFFKAMEMLRPRTVDHHNPYQPLFTFKDLNTCQSVWVKNHTLSNKLDSVFIGPYKVLSREEKHFVLQRDSKEWIISKEFIKPEYIVNEHFPV